MASSGDKRPPAVRTGTTARASGGVAHDFNNLLIVIIGNAEFLSEQLKDHPTLQRLANDIAAAGDRGARLVQRLLETPGSEERASPSVPERQRRKAGQRT
jgi:nitrogen-specific signal transduction histidine kinase